MRPSTRFATIAAAIAVWSSIAVADFATGSYVGDGAATQTITTVPFQPDFLIVKSEDKKVAMARTRTMTGSNSKALVGGTALQTDMILSLDPNGFTVGPNDTVNKSGVVFHWIAFREVAGIMKVGTYVGDNSGDRVLSPMGFDPEMIIVMAETGQESVHRTGASNLSFDFDSGVGMTDLLTVPVPPNGFRIGGDGRVNSDGVTYHYVCWPEIPGRQVFGSHVGNGAATQDVSVSGLRPEYVIVRNVSAGKDTMQHPESLGRLTDSSLYFSGNAVTSDMIQALLPEGFRVGSDDAVNGSGDFHAYMAWGTPVYSVSGRVFEDADFAGNASAYDGGVGDKALAGVDVELYDGGTDAYIASTTTAGDGSFSLGGLTDGSYKVRVRSFTIGSGGAAPKGGLNASVPGTWPNPLAEMTWGNGSFLYGGQSPTADDTTTGNNAGPGDTWVAVSVSGANLTGVDLGFAYNLIVNTNEDTNADNARSAQGSLRQFIKNANAIGSAGGTTASSSEFRIPTSDPNYDIPTGVFTITPTAQLPDIADSGTTLDASTQGDNTSQTNSGNLGTGGKVGVNQLDLSTVPAPEIEIAGSETFPYGLRFTGGSGTLRGLAIYGFGLGNTGEGNVFVADAITGPLIEQNVIGSGAAAFVDPGSGFRGWENVYSDGADNGTIRNNLIGFGGTRGILIAGGSPNWTIEDNELRDNSLEAPFGDGLAIDPGQANVTGNLIVGSASQGVVLKGATGSTFTDNTIMGNGIGTDSASGNASGMTFRSTAAGHTVEYNEFIGNYGAGLSVNNGSTGIKITRNSFSANGTIVARNSDPKTDQIGIDLNNPSDDASAGTSPFVSLNDPGDDPVGNPGGNDLLNYPVLDTALINGPNLELTGWARPGSVIELFVADGDPSGFGEGQTYKLTLTENGTGAGGEDPYTDLDTGPATLYTNPVNGLNQGTDTTNRFSFSVPLPAGVTAGTELTATARDGSNNTSEFSGQVTVTMVPFVISGYVFEDVNYGGGAGRNRAAAAADAPTFTVDRPGLTVELYDAAGSFLSTTTTNVNGEYGFAGLADGSYQVRVVNDTVGSSRPAATGAELAVQTFRTDASSGAAVAVPGEVGGADPAAQDSPENVAMAALGTLTAQSVAPVLITGGGPVPGVDFGFNFDTIVNTNENGQGSLQQFLRNSNLLTNGNLDQDGLTAGVETSLFMIPSNTDPWGRAKDPNFDAGRGVAVIAPTVLLDAVSDPDTAIDGGTQTSAVGDTNTAVLGTGGNVGVTPVALPQLAGPEIEIRDGAALLTGIDIQADDTIVRNVAIYGFGNGSTALGSIRVGIDATTNFTGVILEDIVLGSSADSFTDPDLIVPGSRSEGANLAIRGADGGILRRSLVGFSGRNGVSIAVTANDWAIENSEVRRNGIDEPRSDGVGINNDSQRIVFTDSLFVDNRGAGVDYFASVGDHTLTNNTFDGNGWGGVETAGLRMFGSGSVVERNVFTNQVGSGVLAVVDDPAFPTAGTPATQHKITRNHFFGNGSNAIDLQTTLDIIAPGDGITLNDGTLLGDSSVPDVCGIVATHGNEGLDTPIVDLVLLGPVTSTVRGRACPGSTVEIYRAVADGDSSDTLGGSDYGEGVEYLATTTAALGTGLFDISTVPGLSPGDSVSAIAIDGSNNTSEFSSNLPAASLKIIKRAFQSDGTPIANGSTLPPGMPVKIVFYIDNPSGAITDVSLQDVLDPLYAYQSESMLVDNTLVSSVVCPGGVCDEAAIFAQVDGSGTPLGDGDAVTPTIDADVGSYASGTKTIDLGDSGNGNNAQLDLTGNRVWALVFTITMQ